MSATTGTTASPATSATRRFRSPAVTQPRVNKNTLFSYTHTLRPNLYNDFRIGYHRIDFDTLNDFSVNGVATAGADLGIPGFNGDVRYNNPGHPEHQHQQLQRPWRRGCELVPVRHDVPDVERHGLQPRARTTSDSGSTCGGWRPAGARRTIRAGCFDSPATSPAIRGRLHAGIAADGDSADRPNPGPRRRLAQRLLRQRRLAGVTKPHAEPRPALRAEHARPDLRGAAPRCWPKTWRRSSRRSFPAEGFKFTNPNYKDIAPAPRCHLSPRREDRAARRLRDLLQPEPDELVHVPDQQPAARGRVHVHLGSGESHVVIREPDRRGGAGRHARHDLADARSPERPQGSMELRRAAGACARHGARPAVPRLEHQPPGSQLLQQHAAARARERWIRGGRARSSAAAASSRTI